jgi:AraC-like DNA-binding protein
MHDFVVREMAYSPGLRQRRHAHDYSNITIVVAGKIEEAAESGEYCAYAGSVVMKGAGCEHEDRIGGHGARTISIQFHGESPLAAGTWSWLDTPAVVRRAIAVRRASQAVERDRAVEELITAVTAKRNDIRRPPWVEAIAARIERGYDQTVSFGDLASQLGLHPAYASRAFHAHCGMSMSEYLQAVRLRHARIALSSSRRSVAAIAGECGFSDSSHLCRTFTRMLAVTPRAYRRLTG